MLASKKRMIRATDNAPRPYKCTVCPQAFKQKGHLQQHMRIHTGVKPYRCDLCGYASTIRGNLTSHIKLRHSNNNHKLRKFRCPTCGLYFKFFDSLTVHIASRHTVPVVDNKQGEGASSDAAPRPQAEEQITPPLQQQQQHHQQEDDLLHHNSAPMAINAMSAQAESFQFPPAYNLPHGSADYADPTMQMLSQSQQESVQQWQVINNSNIEARNEGAAEPQAHPVSTETDPCPSDVEMKTEMSQLSSCSQQHEMPVSSLPLVSIGFSPASIQQKLKFSSQSRTAQRESLNRTREESSRSHGRSGEEATDTGARSHSFSEDEQSNNAERGSNVGNITSSTQREVSSETVQILPSDSSQGADVEKPEDVTNMVCSRRGTSKYSTATFRDSNNFSGRSPTPVSPLSLSHHSAHSPGVHVLSSSNQPIPSPSTSSILAPGSPSRKLANRKSKFRNKDSLQCEFCDIVFGDTVLHTIHMGWHSHHHPFQCGVCGQQCKDKYDFMCHFTRGHDT